MAGAIPPSFPKMIPFGTSVRNLKLIALYPLKNIYPKINITVKMTNIPLYICPQLYKKIFFSYIHLSSPINFFLEKVYKNINYKNHNHKHKP